MPKEELERCFGKKLQVSLKEILLRDGVYPSPDTTPPLAHPRLSNRIRKEHKMSSGGSGIAFLSPPMHCLASPISQVHNLYQPRNELHENSAGGGRNIWATYCTCHCELTSRTLSDAVRKYVRDKAVLHTHSSEGRTHLRVERRGGKREKIKKKMGMGDGRWKMGGRQGKA